MLQDTSQSETNGVRKELCKGAGYPLIDIQGFLYLPLNHLVLIVEGEILDRLGHRTDPVWKFQWS